MAEQRNEFEIKDSGQRQEFESGARRDTQEDKPRYSLISYWALERVVWVFTRGAKKYGDHNWQRGMPYSRYLDSAGRHLAQWVKGERDEDHLAMAVWNLMAILHHEEVGPEGLDDVHPAEFEEGDGEDLQMDQLPGSIRVNPIQPGALVETFEGEIRITIPTIDERMKTDIEDLLRSHGYTSPERFQ